jgi:predicted phosphate transport protein (TIGR00153 family)
VSIFRRRADERLLELIDESGANVRRAGALLRDMLAEFPERRGLAREILLAEQEGDRITHDILHRAGQSRVRSPFDSRDLHDLVSAIDDIVDHAEQTADSLGLYGVEAPMEQAQELADVLARAADAVARALSAMRRGDDLGGILVEIHQLENDGDRLSRDAIASLFAKGIDPMVVIRWKDIFESLEQAIDSCETVAHMIEGLQLRDARA